MTPVEKKQLIEAISSGDASLIDGISKRHAFSIEIWTCKNGYWQTEGCEKKFSESEFKAYVEFNKDTKLIFLSGDYKIEDYYNIQES